MGDLTLICPLCCNKIFNSKEALVEHLASIISNLFCPVCNSKVSSIEQLSEHLSVDNCTPIDTVQTIIFENPENNEYKSENSTTLEYKTLDDDNSNPEINSDFTQIQMVEPDDMNKMQIDLMKCLQTQELKLVKEDGENRYIIVAGHDEDLNQDEVITKQRKDGTISFKSLKDIKDEDSDVAETIESSNDESTTQVQEYSCSTCQVSFTSVFDHITNYHNDQDVVVEGNMSSALPDVEFETVESEEPSNDNDSITSRRVITETGDIVETPLPVKDKLASEKTQSTEVSDTTFNAVQVKPLKELATGRGNKRFVQIDKLCDSVVRDLKKSDPKYGPTHKIVIAPPILTPEGETLKMYNCTCCSLSSSELADYRSTPCKGARYPCSQCSVTYDNSKSLCAHMKVHKPKSEIITSDFPETYECEICSTVFLTNKSLKLHKRMHDPIKSRRVDPPRNSITSEDRYQCDICDKMIPYDYRDLHRASHDNDKMLNCGICNKKFSSAEYLEMHMNVHNLEKAPQIKSDKTLPYSCIYCDRKFARPHEKVKHERIHTGEKPHECEICGKTFRVSYCLTLHMRTHTGARPYACPHCDKRFKAHSVYNHHLLTHSEVRAYKCPFCPKAFKTAVQLAGHKNSHTKPFSCTQCNRPFASLYAVRIHTETHNRQNNLKFRCTLCGASYARAFALKDHIKQAHKGDTDNVDPLTGQEWIKPTTDVDKDLTEDITDDLEIPGDEFIVPN